MTALKSTFYVLSSYLWNSGLRLPGADDGTALSMVCFHGVHDRTFTRIAPPPTSSVSAESFEANVRLLRRQYRIISLGHAVAMLEGQVPWQPRCAVLTFDDSLSCTVDVAFPILRRHGLTATIFLSTAAIESRQPYWWLRVDHAWHCGRTPRAEAELLGRTHVLDRQRPESLRHLKAALRRSPAAERDQAVDQIIAQLGLAGENVAQSYPYASLLSWDDARRAAADGFSIGSHTVTHPNLTTLSVADAAFELAESKRVIEAQLGRPCLHFCYPYGAFTAEVAALAPELGYEAAVSTVAPGRNYRGDGLFALRRYTATGAPHKLPYVFSGCPDGLRRRRRPEPAAAART